jgi:hypothetical protein
VDRAMIALEMPFSGLPAWAETLFYAVFVLIVLVWLWTLVLFVLRDGRSARHRIPTWRPATRSCGCSSCRP